ncbi:PREDICTED: ribonuclease P protein subunit rpr2 [Dufourea novaeangliae]|uniref:ribonuclease P protein subunit rpr2 n=1 Tax=Dufourea novaeangliae TaxID=178035 RepID=UPI0007677CD8|nr:PREDICTED: ribonuclease P protein subunit rpr2 [Dufourea novaeangliae]
MDSDTKVCQGKNIFERMNYLYQASYLMALKNRVAASYYGNIMTGCAKKSVLRIESDIKRTICKCCQSPLIPGETAKVRLVSKPVKGVKSTCLICLGVKKYATKKGYKLWIEQDKSVIQIYNYVPTSEVVKIKPKSLDKDVMNVDV